MCKRAERDPITYEPMVAEHVAAVMSKLPPAVSTLINLMHHQIFLAGGFIRDVLASQQPYDIDLFIPKGANAEQQARDAAGALLDSRAYTRLYSNNILVGVSGSIFPDVHIIFQQPFRTAQELVAGFDFTICQAAVWAEDLGKGWRSLQGSYFAGDIEAKRLALVAGIERTTLRRVVRMYSKGYEPPSDIESSAVQDSMIDLHAEIQFLREQLAAAEPVMVAVDKLRKVLNGDGRRL